MNSYEKDKKGYMNLLKETDADYYIVHARHGRQVIGPLKYNSYTDCIGDSVATW
jgi:hypothetical protein